MLDVNANAEVVMLFFIVFMGVQNTVYLLKPIGNAQKIILLINEVQTTHQLLGWTFTQN